MRVIYSYQNKINLKFYIGQTKNLNRRKIDHKFISKRRGKNHPFYNAIRKYGLDNFTITELESVEDIDSDESEQFWIDFFRSWDRSFGYNIERGGCKIKTISDETKKKISATSMGKCYNSSEHMNKIHKNTGDRLRGTHLSEDIKIKISISRKGQKHTKESKIKMSQTRIERGTFVGKNNPNYGKTGELNPSAKLTWHIVNNIRIDNRNGIIGKALMIKYNISETNMYRILKNKIWKVKE
jgi:hypothetical protein